MDQLIQTINRHLRAAKRAQDGTKAGYADSAICLSWAIDELIKKRRALYRMSMSDPDVDIFAAMDKMKKDVD